MVNIKKLVSINPNDAYFKYSHKLVGLMFDVSEMTKHFSQNMQGNAYCLDEVPELPEHQDTGFYFYSATFE